VHGGANISYSAGAVMEGDQASVTPKELRDEAVALAARSDVAVMRS